MTDPGTKPAERPTARAGWPIPTLQEFAQAVADAPRLSPRAAAAVAAVSGDRMSDFVSGLRDDLLAGGYRPQLAGSAEEAAQVYTCAVVVGGLIAARYPAPPLPRPTPGAWLASAASSGLVVANALDLTDCFVRADPVRLAAACRPRLEEDGGAWLAAALVTELGGDPAALSAAFSDVIYADLDAALATAVSFGGDSAGRAGHLAAARVRHEVVVMADKSSEYDWLLPATLRRLCTEMERIGYDPEAAATRSAVVGEGNSFQAFGWTVWRGRGVFGGRRFRHRHDDARGAPRPEPLTRAKTEPSRRAHGTPAANRPAVTPPAVLPPDRGPEDGTGAGVPPAVARRVRRGLAAAVRPALALVALLKAVRIDRGRVTAALASRPRTSDVRPSALTTPACLAVAGICLAAAGGVFYSGLSGEVPVSAHVSGFHRGTFNRGTLLVPDNVGYGLYLPSGSPPATDGRPLIVFLHGHLPAERTLDRVLKVGLPRSIERLRAGGDQGFPFAVLFPLDLEGAGSWEPEARPFSRIPELTKYVTRRHSVDPNRVYLTGLSNGARAAWQLAERSPDLWAAVVSVSSQTAPAAGVKGIPAWVFEGGNDDPIGHDYVPVLRRAGCEVRHTVYPNRGHDVWKEAYDERSLYAWLHTKRRDRR